MLRRYDFEAATARFREKIERYYENMRHSKADKPLIIGDDMHSNDDISDNMIESHCGKQETGRMSSAKFAENPEAPQIAGYNFKLELRGKIMVDEGENISTVIGMLAEFARRAVANAGAGVFPDEFPELINLERIK